MLPHYLKKFECATVHICLNHIT